MFLLLPGCLDRSCALALLDELDGVANVLGAILRTLHGIGELGRASRLLNEAVEDVGGLLEHRNGVLTAAFGLVLLGEDGFVVECLRAIGRELLALLEL